MKTNISHFVNQSGEYIQCNWINIVFRKKEVLLCTNYLEFMESKMKRIQTELNRQSSSVIDGTKKDMGFKIGGMNY